MTLDEAIKRFGDNAEYERSHGSLQGCLEFRQLAEWLTELKELKEQAEPCKIHLTCTDEEIANSFIEDVGAVKDQLEKQPCEDCVSRQAVLDAIATNCIWENEYNLTSSRIKSAVEKLPSVQPKSEDSKFLEFLANTINPNEMEQYLAMYHSKEEKTNG